MESTISAPSRSSQPPPARHAPASTTSGHLKDSTSVTGNLATTEPDATRRCIGGLPGLWPTATAAMSRAASPLVQGIISAAKRLDILLAGAPDTVPEQLGREAELALIAAGRLAFINGPFKLVVTRVENYGAPNSFRWDAASGISHALWQDSPD